MTDLKLTRKWVSVDISLPRISDLKHDWLLQDTAITRLEGENAKLRECPGCVNHPDNREPANKRWCDDCVGEILDDKERGWLAVSELEAKLTRLTAVVDRLPFKLGDGEPAFVGCRCFANQRNWIGDERCSDSDILEINITGIHRTGNRDRVVSVLRPGMSVEHRVKVSDCYSTPELALTAAATEGGG